MYLIFIAGLISENQTFAQSKYLVKLDSVYKCSQLDAEIRIRKYLKSNSVGRVVQRQDGSIIGLVDVSPSGVPIYIKSDNAGVAASLGINELRAGGSLGLNLEGSGIQLGIWDDGRVRNDHVEYVGRVTQVDNPSAGFSFHSTHVLGTMIASGVNTNAKGMAPKASAIAFDFFNDVSEMIGQAGPGQSSIILSNHSYGTLSGWDNGSGAWVWHGDPSISTTRDWKFGFYNSASGLYDDLAYNAPYYLIVKSAGNDTSDIGDGSRSPDCDPFDCIPTNGVAKNIITVGAVKKLTGPYTGPTDVVITNFSSLGPTDDGRIKPDIVAPGQSVFSSSSGSTSAYETLSGTSMSAPATTGTLALLQELYKNLNAGNLMKSATLKALVIHTAREAGQSPGPDYKFGWGLLSAEEAAKTLIEKDDQNIFVKELSLNNNEIFEMTLQPKEHAKITATLVWTDPAGQVLTPSLNPTTKMLKNDLDLRLVDDGGTFQFPWKLNGASPSVAATKGDNIVDNVEKLEFDDPEPRNYKLRINHKGTLVSGKQDFSLIITYTSVVDPRTSYYWIGNTGNWNNGSNWSLSSGGVAANMVPTINDKVVFDENSFSANGQTVSMTQDQQCFSVRWFATELINLSLNGHQLTIADGVNILSGNISSSSPGTFLFSGNSTTETIIELNDNHLEDVTLKFSGNDSKWLLTGNFNVNDIQLAEGELTIGAGSIKLNSLGASGSLTKKLILDKTVISGLVTMAVDLSNIEVESDAIKIEVPLLGIYSLTLGTNVLRGSVDLMGGEINIFGNGGISDVAGFGKININGNHSWGNFNLSGVSNLMIEASTVQKIENNFILQTTSSSRIVIASTGPSLATLDFESHQKICLDHLDIQNIAVTGESIVNAGLNSTVANSPNWLQNVCGNILFADFDFDFNCDNAAVFFNDKSSGPVTSRNWNFGDIASLQNSSSALNPIHLFESSGQFQVSVEISNGSTTASYSKPVTLSPSILPENKIELSNGRLISFLPANKYQWVLNGALLPNTDLRSIDFTAGLGQYAVLTFDELCNRQSEIFLVTGVDEGTSQLPISIFPNPASDELFVDGINLVDIKLVNGLGQFQQVQMDKVDQGVRINVSALSTGLYVLVVQTTNSLTHHWIVIR